MMPGLALLAAAAMVVSAGQAGCYRRVISAKGVGADRQQISEPYQSNSQLDNWIFGKRPSDSNLTRPY
jgi:hypothetical protein